MSLGRVLFRLIAVLVSVALVLGLAELGLRQRGYEYEPITVVARNDSRAHHSLKDMVFVQDPKLIWRPKAGVGPFNAQGYRGRIVEESAGPSEFRVLAVGDSNTLGWHGDVEGASNWPEFLEAELKTTQAGAVVINAGAYGYTSFQGLGRLKEALSFSPDLVLISFGGNDAHRVSITDAEYVKKSVGGLAPRLLEWRLGQLLASAWDRQQGRNRESELTHRVNPQDYRDNLQAMIELCREQDISCVLLTRPYVGESTDPNWWKTYGKVYRDATIEVAQKNDLVLIDVFQEFDGKEELFADESHFTKEGHDLAAQFIAEALKPVIDQAKGAKP